LQDSTESDWCSSRDWGASGRWFKSSRPDCLKAASSIGFPIGSRPSPLQPRDLHHRCIDFSPPREGERPLDVGAVVLEVAVVADGRGDVGRRVAERALDRAEVDAGLPTSLFARDGQVAVGDARDRLVEHGLLQGGEGL
jgi:hypothetical protein